MSGIVGGAGSKSGVIGTTELDYEEGAFTPAIKIGSSAYTGNYDYTPVGHYTRIGNRCLIAIKIRIGSDGGSGTGGVKFVDLPFTSSSTQPYTPFALMMSALESSTPQTYYSAWMAESSAIIDVMELNSSGGMGAMQGTRIKGSYGLIHVSGNYEIA